KKGIAVLGVVASGIDAEERVLALRRGRLSGFVAEEGIAGAGGVGIARVRAKEGIILSRRVCDSRAHTRKEVEISGDAQDTTAADVELRCGAENVCAE